MRLRDDIAALRFDNDLRERKHFTQEAYHGYCEAVNDVLGLVDKHEAASPSAEMARIWDAKPSDERSCKIVPGICETHFLEESGCPKPSDERPARAKLATWFGDDRNGENPVYVAAIVEAIDRGFAQIVDQLVMWRLKHD